MGGQSKVKKEKVPSVARVLFEEWRKKLRRIALKLKEYLSTQEGRRIKSQKVEQKGRAEVFRGIW